MLVESLYRAIAEHHLCGIIAFAVTVFATPLAAIVARKTGVMDMPDTFLKPHARPTPYLGGAAICLGWLVALGVAMATGRADWSVLFPILIGGTAMSVLGLIDDIKDVSAKLRLAVGAVIIAGVLITTGIGFRLADSILKPLCEYLPDAGDAIILQFLDHAGVPISVLLSIFIVLGACNSANLIDGLDGLCSGVTAIISLSFFLLAAHLYAWNPTEPNHQVRLVLAIAMCGATLGFLPMNFNPAKIFMGDAGSVLLGFNCGMLILLFAEWGFVRWVVGALLIFALPVFDTALAMYRRWNIGRSIFVGDRSHFYDQLVQRGMSVRQAVLTCYGLTLLYACIGLTLMRVPTRYAILAALGVCVATFLAAWKAGLTHPESRTKSPGDTE
jgi:UDP-GlcNAc:undecaprenyl-phosphate GlcNAc-1-phosphate transferase